MTERSVPVDFASPDLPAGARAALAAHDWAGAYDGFTRAEAQAPLSGADLEALAQAAFFTGHADQQMEAEERAFQAYQAAGDLDRCAYIAIDLAQTYYFKGKPSIATAWFRRAEKLLDGQPESYAQGYLELARSFLSRSAGDIEGALKQAETAIAIGFRATDSDLQAMGEVALGGLKIATGSTAEGLGLMEEATISAVNGELSPITTGVTYCAMISACRDLTDYKRASEWTEATERWCEKQSVSGFPGICRIHRAEVIALGGAWERADAELRRATTELANYNAVPPMADGYYALGELRLRMGDLDKAEEALRQAHSLGRSPQPAMARIRLAQGNVGAASKAIASAINEGSWDLLSKTRLLPAQVEIALAARDLTTARTAAEQLDEIMDAYDAPAIQATRRESWGRVFLAEGDAVAAARELRVAIALWREVAAPYEVARGRTLLAEALRMLEDDDAADLELEAARDEFVRLGARLDAETTEVALRSAAERRAAPMHVHKTFMFTDIEGSTKLAEALGDAAWDSLLRWHDDAVRAQVKKAGGELVNSTGDGFFLAFDTARRAVDCAIAIQQVLAEHRRTSGFALSVRIGLHSAEASQRVDDYSGVGVHLASRVAALGAGGEIVATADTLAEAGNVTTTDPREATLRGISAPVSVATISWS